MNVVIRPMQERDLSCAARLMEQLLGRETPVEVMRDRLAWVDSSPVDWLYVAEVAGEVRGVMGFRLRENLASIARYGEVSILVVDAATRRQGVGRALMAYAEELAHQHDCLGTWLVSGLGRTEEAHRFYQMLGYEITGYRFVKRFGE